MSEFEEKVVERLSLIAILLFFLQVWGCTISCRLADLSNLK
jgi:hypothetical protein